MTAKLRVSRYLQASTDVGGPARVKWLAALADRVEELTARWGLELGDPFEPGGNCSWVAPGIDGLGRDVVPGDAGAAPVRVREGGEHADGSRLARAVGPQQREHAAGGDRQLLHERIRVHSRAVADSAKSGSAADLLDLLRADPAFRSVDLAKLLDPNEFVGRAPEQVDEFIRDLLPRLQQLKQNVSSKEAQIQV